MRPILVLRPEPGNAATCARLRAEGRRAIAAPLFAVRPLLWEAPPAADFDALMLTSAQAVRHAGPALQDYRALPVLAVGEATGAAARAAGFDDVTCGDRDADALAELAGAIGATRLLHLCGREHRPPPLPHVQVARRHVYASEAVTALPPIMAALLHERPVALLHSPRAATLLAALLPERRQVSLAAISPAAAAAAGEGWETIAIAPHPRDDALLAEAVRLCDKDDR